MQSILDALLAQYVNPYQGAQGGMGTPQMSPNPMPAGAPQMSPNPQQPMQPPQSQNPVTPAPEPMGPPQPQPQNPVTAAPEPMGPPPPPANPLEDVQSALEAGMSPDEGPDATDTQLAFESGAAPFERKWENTQNQEWRGVAGGIEWMVDKIRAKKLQPQRDAVDAARGQLTYNRQQEAQQNRIKTRTEALVKMGNSPEEAYAIASTTGADDKFDISKYDNRKEPLAEEQNRNARKEFLSQNPDLVARIGQEGADRFWTEGKIEGPGGMSMMMRPDGTMVMTENGETTVMPLTTGAKSEQQNTLLNTEMNKSALNRIMKNSRRSYLTTMGRAGTLLGNTLDRAGLSDNQLAEFGAQRSAWANEIAHEVMAFRKEITGVAGGPQEMAKIEAMFANPEMGPDQFARNMEMLVTKYQNEANGARTALGMQPVVYEPFKYQWPEDEEEQESIEDIAARYR